MLADKSRVERSVSEFLGLLESPRPIGLEDFLSTIDPDIRAAVEDSCRLALSLHSVFGSRLAAPSGSGVGARLGSFKLLRFLGEGGMGRVYLARQETLGRDVAVKVIRGDRALRAEFRGRFDRESRLIASLDHPGIVKIIDRGEDNEQIYFVMEFVEGPSLRELIRGVDRGQSGSADSAGLLPAQHPATYIRAARLICEVASAVAHAHGRGVSHRDLKPENIQIGPGGRPRIIDFGLASDSATASSLAGDGVLGTAAYLPPTGRKPATGVQRDLWAMGVILYEVVTLRRPFEGSTVPEVSAEIERGRFVPVSTHRPAIPRDLDRIVRKALSPDPVDRYATAADFEADLGRFLAGVPVLAGVSSPAALLLRHFRRHRQRYVAGIILVLVAAGGWRIARHLHDRRLEDDLLRQVHASDPEPPSVDVHLARLAHRKEQVDFLLARPEISTSARDEAKDVRRAILADVATVYGASIARIERARGSRPGVPLSDYRPPSEPDLFQALAIAAQAKVVAAGAILDDPFAKVFPVLTIHADCERSGDAVVSVCPINLLTGLATRPVLTSQLPMNAVAIPPGLYVIVIEVHGFGRAEYVRDFARSAVVDIHPRIVADGVVRNGVAMVDVPAGTYRVGQRDGNPDNIYREREVSIAGFAIDVYETTCAEYREFLEANRNEVPPAAWGRHLEHYEHAWDARPVSGVSWMVAQRYAEWRGKRLPTWIEWQIAVRGPAEFVFPWGNEATIEDLPSRSSVGMTAGPPPPVGSAPMDRSPFGVIDGYGSLREWTCLPYLTNVERVIYANSGWRMTVSNAHTRTRWDPRSLAAGVTPVSEGAPESETIGLRCLRSFSTDR